MRARKKNHFFRLEVTRIQNVDYIRSTYNWNPGTSMAAALPKRNVYFFPFEIGVACSTSWHWQQLNWITLFGSLNLITSWEVRVHWRSISFRYGVNHCHCRIYDVIRIRLTWLLATHSELTSFSSIQWLPCTVSLCEAIHMHSKSNGMCPMRNCFSDITCFLHSISILRLCLHARMSHFTKEPSNWFSRLLSMDSDVHIIWLT